jgi:hypothetical protein
MQVLGSLLPGVREVRAPLAAGYTWLLAAWLLYGSDASQHPTGVTLDLKRLHEQVSTAGSAVALSFVAYLIGVFSIAATGVLAGWTIRTLRPFVTARLRRTPWWFADVASRTDAALEIVVARRMDEMAAALEVVSRVEPLAVHEQLAGIVDPVIRRPTEHRIAERLQEAVGEEFDQMGRQLIGREPELFGEYDRLRAEAELRAGLVLPGIALGATLVWVGGGGWRAVGAAIVVAALGLSFLAKSRAHDAIDVVVSALRNERVDSPVLALITHAIDQKVKAGVGSGPASVGAADGP